MKLPLVSATRAATDQWHALGFDGCLENRVVTAILAGDVFGNPRSGPALVRGDGFECDVSKEPRDCSSRPLWKVRAVRATATASDGRRLVRVAEGRRHRKPETPAVGADTTRRGR